jgi:hypothetical protein
MLELGSGLGEDGNLALPQYGPYNYVSRPALRQMDNLAIHSIMERFLSGEVFPYMCGKLNILLAETPQQACPGGAADVMDPKPSPTPAIARK